MYATMYLSVDALSSFQELPLATQKQNFSEEMFQYV